MSKKLDKSLLPQPQKPIGWKRGILQISTDSRTDLRQPTGQLPTTKFATTKNNNVNNFSSNFIQTQQPTLQPNLQSQYTTPKPFNHQTTNRQSRQSITQKPPMGMTASQYSLEQKELLTFAANEQEEQRNSKYQSINNNFRESQSNFQSSEQKRTNRFDQSNSQSVNNDNSRNQSSSVESSEHSRVNRSSSKNKQHKSSMYRHNLPQNQEFITYSVVTKQSKSGMFSNQKLLVLNSFKRQLCYYSKLPKLLPFGSYGEMEKKYFVDEKPKEVIELDKVRRFMFVPAKGSLASVAVSYVNQKGQRKEWKLGMGHNSLMNQWIQLVNEVFKKQHYSIIKSQVKYPPKPKKQPQNKSNNYQTKFTKTLKHQVLPVIKQSSIRSSKADDSQLMNQSRLSGSGNKSVGNSNLGKSREKQYIVDKSKFVNTKSYIIDLEDVSNEDIFYQPEPIKEEQVLPKNQSPQESQIQQNQNNNNNNQNSQNSINSRYWHGLNESQNGNSRFTQQLQQRQRQINNEHKNRVNTFMRDANEYSHQQQQPHRAVAAEIIITPQPVVLTKKPSGERLSQTTHKDLNIHIDSRIAFDETQRQKELAESSYRNDEMTSYQNNGMSNVSNSHVYEPFSRISINNNNVQQSRVQTNSNNQQSIIQPKPVPIYPEPQDQSRKRVYTQVSPQSYLPNPQHQQWHKITFQNNSDSMRSSTSSHYEQPVQKASSKDKYRLEQPPKNSRTIRQNISSSFMTDNSQIEDIIVGGKLHQGYILNFSPYSSSNNWFRLWLQTEPVNRVEIYASFVRASRTLVKRLIDAPHQFTTCYTLSQNNTHITFSLQNITLKFPFKLPLPQGLGEFISVMDFIRSQDFLTQVFKYQTELIDEYNNYEYILGQLATEFNAGVLSLPVYFPMCCLVRYKGITVLCKGNIETANLNCYRIPQQEYRRYEKELEYIEECCHVRFGSANSQDNKPFDLYSIHVSSYNKSVIYMDNLTRFLPLMPNPLLKNPNPSMQLNGNYIEGNIKKGIISPGKDIDQIQKHLVGSVIKRSAQDLVAKARYIVAANQLDQFLYHKGGLRQEYLGILYRRVEEKQQKLMTNSYHTSSLVLTEIILTQYSKACQLYFMKEYFKELYASISNASSQTSKVGYNNQQRLSTSQASNNSKTIKNLPSYTSVSSTFGQSYQSTILQILHYLIYRNSKVWTVLSVCLDEKYGISQFRKLGSQRQVIEALTSRVTMQYLVLGLLSKLGVQAQVKSWANNMSWGTLPLTQDNLNLTPYCRSECYPLKLFNPQYQTLINQLQEISASRSFSSTLTSKNYFPVILQLLNISEQCHENQTTIIKSAAYELLQYGYTQERQLIDFSLSYFIPTSIKDNKSTKALSSKEKQIDLYQKLLDQELVRNSRDVTVKMFEVNFNGIKWLIKQNQYELAEVLIQEQLQAISLWYTGSLLQTKCKFLDLAASFYHKKLSNRNNLAIDYAIRSLQLAMDNKAFFTLSTCAQKCFQAANIHFDCGLIEKSLELYELAEDFIFQSQRNKTLGQTDLSIEFLRIYLRKAQIKLAMGKKNQTLYQCLECLRKCQQFQDLINSNHDLSGQNFIQAEKQKENLAQLEINVFQLIFRCYEVTKNLPDMERIAQLCCNKFIEDKVMILRMNKPLRNKSLEDSISPALMSKLLKICWISIINKLAFTTVKHPQQHQPPLNKTMTISSTLTRKSFCLSGALSQPPKKSPQLNHYQKLEQLMQKLEALCKLYPKSRYDKDTLTMFVCREVVEASAKMNLGKSMARGEYHLIGGRKKGIVSGRVQEMISSSKGQNEGQVTSTLYQRLWEVIRQLTDNHSTRSSKRIQRYQTQSSPYHQRRASSRQKPRYYQSIEPSQHYPQTSTKKQPSKFYHSPQVFTSEFDQENSQDQPQLRMSAILGKEEQRSRYVNAYDIYSLKDEMDRKYMLMQAIFGLCGREFVLGLLQEAIDYEKRKVNGIEGYGVFYE